ncbi:S46 family peptidase, partial [Calditrichota bacterium]
MWPRHTADFTFLRAYVSPDGRGADYSQKNVPYNPKVHFRVAQSFIKDGDFSFIMGYPGKTYRNYSTPELLFDIEKLKTNIKERLEYISFFEEAGKKGTALEIKYASMLRSLYNGLKNYRGKLEAFAKADLVNVKKELDEQFNNWNKTEQSRFQNYGGIVNKIEEFLESEYKKFYNKENEIKNLTYYRRGPALLTQAHTIVRISLEGQKPDMQRDLGFQERDLPKLIRHMKLAERRYDADVDRDYTIFRFHRLIDLDKDNIPKFLQSILIQKGDFKTWATSAYQNTKIANTDFRLSLIKKSPKELKSLDDPYIDIAFELEKELAELREQKHILDQRLEDLKKIYIKGLMEMHNFKIAPDANSTFRFTSGPIKGYSPRDAVYYQPITTLKG